MGAIAQAVTRPVLGLDPGMRFVAVKTDQQSVLMRHRVRELLVRQRTMLINALRGHLAEFGVVAARGPGGVNAAIAALHEAQDGLPDLARQVLHGLIDQIRAIGGEIAKAELPRPTSASWHGIAPAKPVGVWLPSRGSAR